MSQAGEPTKSVARLRVGEAIEAEFDVPEQEVPETDSGSVDEGGPGGEDTGVDSLGTESGTGEGSGGIPSGDGRGDGCNCSTTSSGLPAGWLAFGLLGLVAIRRKRA